MTGVSAATSALATERNQKKQNAKEKENGAVNKKGDGEKNGDKDKKNRNEDENANMEEEENKEKNDNKDKKIINEEDMVNMVDDNDHEEISLDTFMSPEEQEEDEITTPIKGTKQSAAISLELKHNISEKEFNHNKPETSGATDPLNSNNE